MVIAVNEDGYREVLGAAEGIKEDKASWVSFFRWLRGRGLDGVKLVVWDKCLGMLEASEHWTRIRTNNVIERLNRGIRRRTRVVCYLLNQLKRCGFSMNINFGQVAVQFTTKK